MQRWREERGEHVGIDEYWMRNQETNNNNKNNSNFEFINGVFDFSKRCEWWKTQTQGFTELLLRGFCF